LWRCEYHLSCHLVGTSIQIVTLWIHSSNLWLPLRGEQRQESSEIIYWKY
jgi:hypothetical protein